MARLHGKKLLAVRKRVIRRMKKTTHKLPSAGEVSSNWKALKQQIDASGDKEKDKGGGQEQIEQKKELKNKTDHLADTLPLVSPTNSTHFMIRTKKANVTKEHKTAGTVTQRHPLTDEQQRKGQQKKVRKRDIATVAEEDGDCITGKQKKTKKSSDRTPQEEEQQCVDDVSVCKKEKKKMKMVVNEVPEKKMLKRQDIWFDDVDVDIVGGEVVAKQRSLTTSSMSESSPAQLIIGNDMRPRGCIAMDCEMVGGGSDGSHNMLARCSIVNHHGNAVYDKYVQPIDTVSDYRTSVSGIRPSNLRDATPFKTVQKEVSELLEGRILVGHSVQNDLKVLLLSHPNRSTRDTAKYRPFKRAVKSKSPSLKRLAKQLLGLEIQTGEHDSVTDARVAMKLYQMHKFQWEHAHQTEWTGKKKRQNSTKWVPRGRRAQQQKRMNSLDRMVTSRPRMMVNDPTPFNVMLQTDA